MLIYLTLNILLNTVSILKTFEVGDINVYIVMKCCMCVFVHLAVYPSISASVVICLDLCLSVACHCVHSYGQLQNFI